MKLRGFLLALAALANCSCDKPRDQSHRATFGILADLGGLQNDQRPDMLDLFFASRSMKKSINAYDLKGNPVVEYGRQDHIVVMVMITEGQHRNLTLSGFLFDDSREEFSRLYRDLKDELGSRFPNRLTVFDKMGE